MTLDTRFYILDPIDPESVFREGQRLLSVFDSEERKPEQQLCENAQDRMSWVDGMSPAWTWMNQGGQGLPAWLMVHYRPDEMYRSPEIAARHDDCNHPDNRYYHSGEPLCDLSEHSPACWVEVSFDTAYGYHDTQGRGCGDLHALLIAALAGWCHARDLRWRWLNEFTGIVHDDLESLIGLTTGGFEASAWLRTTVLPALGAMIDEEK